MSDQASKPRYTTLVTVLGCGAVLAFAGLDAVTRATTTPRLDARSDASAPAASILSRVRGVKPHGDCAPRDPVSAVRLGDTMEIRIFETLKPEEGNAPTRYERRDLSATAVVDELGEISFGSLGRFGVAGTSPACAEREVSARITTTMGITVAASATFANRPPIAVGGAVAAPGAYPYTAGLTVRRLLALSGGSGESKADQRHRRALEAREAELALQRSRLEAEFASTQNWELPAAIREALTQTMGANLTTDRVAGERALFASARAMRLADNASDAAARESLVAARDLALIQEDAVRDGLAETAARRGALEEELSDDCRGRCSNARLTKEMRLDSMGNRELDLVVALQDRVRIRTAAEAALQMFDRSREVQIVERSRRILNDIGRNWEATAAVSAELISLSGAGPTPELTIERLQVGAAEIFPATPETLLLPGDLLHVGPGGPKPTGVRTAALDEAPPEQETGDAISN